jgi:hypothetical protein
MLKRADRQLLRLWSIFSSSPWLVELNRQNAAGPETKDKPGLMKAGAFFKRWSQLN